MKKKILVTGGAGFIGSNLCERLSKDDNNEVYSLDNYFTGNEENHVDCVTYIKGSTANIDNLIQFKPDVLFHLGEYSRVEQSFDDINKVFEFNILGTQAVLEFAKKHNCKLIYSGSSTKFGDGGLGANQSPYAWSKSSNTQLVKNYGDWFGLKYAITYFYNAYGKREIKEGKYATLIAAFREKMRNNLPLTVVSPGTQKRNFTHIEDIVDALILIGEKGDGDGYCIGTDKSYTILEIAKIFDGKIIMLPERKGNRLGSDIDINKTKKLGWQPKKTIEEYIENCRKNNWI